jgi:outer membrane protein assembly factor BamB
VLLGVLAVWLVASIAASWADTRAIPHSSSLHQSSKTISQRTLSASSLVGKVFALVLDFGPSPEDLEGIAPQVSLASADWPMFKHDIVHSGLSQFDTSGNIGQKIWAYTTGGPVSSSPVVRGQDGIIFFTSDDGNLYGLRPDGSLFTENQGKFFSKSTTTFVRSAAAIADDGSLYIGSADSKKLFAAKSSGSSWSFLTGGPIQSSPVIGGDGTIYVGCDDHLVYAVTDQGASGIQKWTFATGAAVESSPAIGADGTIYVGSDDDSLYAINPNGTQKWAFGTNGPLVSSPAIGSDGTIYVGSLDNNLYAVDPDGKLFLRHA